MNTDSTLGHVGIIPNGNRRWARQNNLELDVAYWIAMQKLIMTIDALFELGASSVSAYLLSKDNLARKRDDLEAVLQAEQRCLTDLLPSLKEKQGLKIFHAGDLHILPESYVQALEQVYDSDDYPRTVVPSLFLCAGYDAMDEISQCISRIAKNGKDIVSTLWVPQPVDLVIRTGGDQRLSGFLPLQCRYAEFFFEPYFFPEIDRRRVEAIVQAYYARERRFGK